MIELLVRHIALLALAAVLSLLLRHRSAALRHALWTMTLGLLLFLPLLQRVPIALPQSLASSLPIAEPDREESRAHIQGGEVVLTDINAPAPPAAAPRSLPWGYIALAAYAMITLTLIARWGVGWAMAARLAHRATPLGTARGVPVLAAKGVGPLTFGWPNGVILVPHERFALEKLVLRHEVAHVRRADFLWQGVGALACALWWWSPFVWLAARQLRREAERACDDFVLNQGVSAPDYADCLLEVAAMKPISLPFAASLVQGELAARVSALLANGKDRRPAAPLAVLGLTALLLPVGLTLTRSVSADVPPAPKAAPGTPPVIVAPRIERLVAPKPAPRPVVVPAKARVLPVVAPQPRKAPAARVVPVVAPAPIAPKTPPTVAAPVLAPSVPAPTSKVADPTIAPDGRLAPATAILDAPPVVAPDGRAPLDAPPAKTDPTAEPKPAPDAEGRVSTGSLAGKRIVLDPGHGGNDAGAMSAADKQVPVLKDLPIAGELFKSGKVAEKDITLLIAKKAAEQLRKEGAIVTLSRNDDSMVSLAKRAELSAGQDLFLSIHVDYGTSENANKSPIPKRFRVALWYHGTGPRPDQTQTFMKGLFSAFPSPEVNLTAAAPVPAGQESLNVDLSYRTTEDALSFSILPDSKIYSKGFAVLRNAKCPAYLIDFGNMNQRRDVARLKDSAFQDKLAQGIVEGAKAIL